MFKSVVAIASLRQKASGRTLGISINCSNNNSNSNQSGSDSRLDPKQASSFCVFFTQFTFIITFSTVAVVVVVNKAGGRSLGISI
jgi:hypothetical protein